MKSIRLMTWLLAAGSLFLWADVRPSTSVAALRPNPEKELENKPVRNAQPISDAEWSDIEKWMAVNTPNQLAFMKELDNGQKEHARQLIAERYRAWKHTADPALKDAMLAQAKSHDEIFGLQIQYRRVKGDRARRHDIREKLRVAVKQLIDAQVAEKNARIAKLKQDVDRMQNNKDVLADQYTNGMLKEVGGRIPGPPPDTSASLQDAAPSQSH